MMPEISVCICTYKRAHLLSRLLQELARQETGGLFGYSVVVVDNDRLRSAEGLVSEWQRAQTAFTLKYCVEPEQSIALARNKAVENAGGEFLAFIDDDEFPSTRWLLTLLEAIGEYDVDGVLGPVKRHFDERPPDWILKGDFYERPTYPTGYLIDWTNGRTGNVLLKRALFEEGAQAFRPQFSIGEDQDFFRRMIAAGHKFIWCNEAVAYEVVPPVRWKRTFLLKRALHRGTISLRHPTGRLRKVATSLVAVPTYTIMLPFTLMIGQHRFMDMLVRLFDHLGRLLAFIGFRPVKSQYVTE
jgi:glycosyltransferase involved in cell wall biosynthesis